MVALEAEDRAGGWGVGVRVEGRVKRCLAGGRNVRACPSVSAVCEGPAGRVGGGGGGRSGSEVEVLVGVSLAVISSTGCLEDPSFNPTVPTSNTHTRRESTWDNESATQTLLGPNKQTSLGEPVQVWISTSVIGAAAAFVLWQQRHTGAPWGPGGPGDGRTGCLINVYRER